MDDNICMKPSMVCSTTAGNNEDITIVDNGLLSNYEVKSWCPSHILDFSDLSIGQYFCFPTSKKFVSYLYWNVVIVWHHNCSCTFIIYKKLFFTLYSWTDVISMIHEQGHVINTPLEFIFHLFMTSFIHALFLRFSG